MRTKEKVVGFRVTNEDYILITQYLMVNQCSMQSFLENLLLTWKKERCFE